MVTYVALGSSFASGPGIDPIVDAGCGRSGNNYPSILARELGADLIDATCGGATVEDVLSRRQVLLTGASVRPQLEAVDPGADLVTITVGGNDLGYVSTLMRCSYRVQPQGVPEDAAAFFSAPVDLAAAQAGLVELPQRLAGLVAAVRGRAPRARVLVVDYLTILAADDVDCPALPMTPEDHRAGLELGRRLEDATAEGARRSGAELVTASAASRGHGVCSPDPWVTGWQFGDPRTGGVVPYHPNAAGMRAVADLIARALRS